MERLTEQIVAWHNRHPLAKRISAFDVHTVGVIALPFMRQNRRPPLPVEPVLTEEVDPLHNAETRDALIEGASDEEDEDGGNEPGAFSRFETDSAPRAPRGPAWLQPLQNLWFRMRRQRWGNHWQWPVFSEEMIPGLSAASVARFALDYGYNEAPGDPHWPRRTAAVDESYVAKGSAKHRGGAWPFELFLVSAGIDAGASRTRVLIGQGGGRSLMLCGRRCISPVRSAIAALLLLGGMAWAGWSWMHPAGEAHVAAEPASAPAAAASKPVPAPVASAPSAAPPPSAASAAGDLASAPTAAVTAPVSVASAPTPAPAASSVMNNPGNAVPASELPDQASGPQPDIRPRLVTVNRAASAPPLRVSGGASAPAPAAATTPDKADKKDPKAQGKAEVKAETRNEPRTEAKAEPKVAPVVPPLSSKPVALVGPPSAKRTDAEAYLARMKDMLTGVTRQPDALQFQVIETPAGFVPTIWPFATREQAQLINATMIARGMKTRAVDF